MSHPKRILTDQQIIAAAIIVDENDANAPCDLAKLVRVWRGMLDNEHGPLVVRWPDGIVATVDSNPSKKSWSRCLIATYKETVALLNTRRK